MAESISPMTGFWILKQNELSDIDKKTLIDLYQPLVGPISSGLYLLLWNEAQKNTMISQRASHSQLLALLDCGVNDFYEARIKLEALSLLRTYKKSDQLGEYLIYELYKPMLPTDFFKESLLSTLLFEKIGRNSFEELAEKYNNSSNSLADAEDITKSFLDVFTIANNDLVDAPTEVKEAQSKIVEQRENIPTIKTNKQAPLDWSFLEQLVSQYGITEAELLSKEDVIYNQHVFYGLDELELSNLIARSLNLVDNSIDEKRFERAAQNKYENRSNIVVKSVVEPEKKTTGNPVIDCANELIPSEYLAYEKQQTNGFVGSAETRTLKALQNRHVLSDPVINILIHYALQNSPTLSQAFVETVANDWSQNKVATPEDALKRINDFTSGRNNRKNNTRMVGRVEKGTDWDKIDAESKNDSFDADKFKKEAAARLKRLREGNAE